MFMGFKTKLSYAWDQGNNFHLISGIMKLKFQNSFLKMDKDFHEGKGNYCDFNLSLEKQVYWVNALNEHKHDQHCGLLVNNLLAISPHFLEEFYKFGQVLLVNWDDGLYRDKCCFLQLRKDGFQLCRCYTLPIEGFNGSGDIKLRVIYCNRHSWDWSYNRNDWEKFMTVIGDLVVCGC